MYVILQIEKQKQQIIRIYAFFFHNRVSYGMKPDTINPIQYQTKKLERVLGGTKKGKSYTIQG